MLAEELRKDFNVDVIVGQVDLSVISAISDRHSRLKEQYIVVDILINNASHGFQGSFLDQSLGEMLDMINLDIARLTAITRLFAEDMEHLFGIQMFRPHPSPHYHNTHNPFACSRGGHSFEYRSTSRIMTCHAKIKRAIIAAAIHFYIF
ncbi:SDR family NAD(P)-dependent oxidoreductase [Pectobacterium aquaticum]|uniref:SDR family NAD(P)-dependent oxidoreductase n=1 Tax=Pectobacterium aquaticum TaxID=2204145 RepID=UPI001D021057